MASSEKKDQSQNQDEHIFVVDDDEKTLKNLRKILNSFGVKVSTYKNPVRALEAIRRSPCTLIITDQRMPEMDGLDLLGEAKRISSSIEVIMMTGYASIDGAVSATKQGAYYYLAKPFTPSALRSLVGSVLEAQRQRRGFKVHLDDGVSSDIIGKSNSIVSLKESIARFAPLDCSVLITGESGTGKELVARALHTGSPRRDGPFMACNVGAFSEHLIVNELFGHEEEAFTGANSVRVGILESANGGTLMLDEISDMPPSMQVKLLRVIQERELLRVGGTRPVPLDVRIVAATARNLKQAVVDNTFREDLFFRLNVVHITLSPLRKRRSDIPLLAGHFLVAAASRMKKPVKDISPEAMRILEAYAFPGNVRELQNIMERAVALAHADSIEPKDLPPDLVSLEIHPYEEMEKEGPTLEELERNYIIKVLDKTGGSRTRAAEILGIDRSSLWRKLKKYKVN